MAAMFAAMLRGLFGLSRAASRPVSGPRRFVTTRSSSLRLFELARPAVAARSASAALFSLRVLEDVDSRRRWRCRFHVPGKLMDFFYR